MKDRLEGKEKIIVWVASVINPVLAGFLFYYMWRKSFPNKAKQANRISFLMAGVWIVGYIFYSWINNSI